MVCAGVTALQNSTSLTSLNLAVCRELTDAAVAALASLPKLSSLDMTFCDHLTDAVVPHLARYASVFASREFEHFYNTDILCCHPGVAQPLYALVSWCLCHYAAASSQGDPIAMCQHLKGSLLVVA